MSTTEPILGIRIETGLQPFQIVQQDERGFGRFGIRGRWGHPDLKGTVQLRVVAEADGATICAWEPAQRQQAGEWGHLFNHIPAGGLYRVESRLVVDPNAPEWGVHGDTVHHWGVGDLWIIGGQSNAAGYGRGPVDDPPALGVHLLRNDERWDVAAHPLNDPTGSTHPNAEAANPGHSPYLCFARALRQALGYPIGLIQTALGGSPLSAWNPVENADAPLYRNLIHCVGLAGGQARGMVWYQGESDCSPAAAASYERRFADFIRRLRSDLGCPELPVIIAQLNRYTAAVSPDDHRAWSVVREAQRQARKLGHVAVVPTLDLPLSDAIHTSSDGNLTLGLRKARTALASVYGRGGEARAPEIESAVLSLDRTAVELTFAPVLNRLAFLGPGEADFAVEDAEGFVPIRAAGPPATACASNWRAQSQARSAFTAATARTRPAIFGMPKRTCRCWRSTAFQWRSPSPEHGSPASRTLAGEISDGVPYSRSHSGRPARPRRSARPDLECDLPGGAQKALPRDPRAPVARRVRGDGRQLVLLRGRRPRRRVDRVRQGGGV